MRRQRTTGILYKQGFSMLKNERKLVEYLREIIIWNFSEKYFIFAFILYTIYAVWNIAQ